MRKPAVVFSAVLLFTVDAAFAQRGAADWMTSAFDAQRSSWVRIDPKISPETMRKPGFTLVWKVPLGKTGGDSEALTPPALFDFYISYRGFRTLGFFGARSNRIIAIDTDLARVEWEKEFAVKGSSAGATGPCPGGMTSAVARPTITAYPAAPTGRGFGRGTPAKSGVGQPYEGAVTIKTAVAPPPRRPPAAKAAAAVPSPFTPHVQHVMALTGDGRLHRFWVSNGHETDAPMPWLSAGAHAIGLVAFDNTAYVATVNDCGGIENGVWALDLSTRKVAKWNSGGKGPAGTVGPAAGPNGTLYVAAGSELTALAPRTLERLAVYKTGGAEFSSSPVVFEFKGRDLIAAATTDGRIHLLDAAGLKSGAALHRTPAGSASGAAGSLTSWQDPAGTRWLLAATGGTTVAWKVVDKDGSVALDTGWTSRDMVAPAPPVVINGVVFALSRGAQGSSKGILYALDPATGKELWNSGDAITSHIQAAGFSAGGGRVYVADHTGTQYSFGFPMEH